MPDPATGAESPDSAAMGYSAMDYKEFLFSETRTALSYARTMMSADRTLLSFSTAGLSLLAGGVGLVGYVDHLLLRTIGWVLIPLGLLVWIRGIAEYRKMLRLMKKVGRGLERQGLYLPGLFIGGESTEPLYGILPPVPPPRP